MTATPSTSTPRDGTNTGTGPIVLRHNAVELALHRVASAGGAAHALLLLHGLGESAALVHPAAHEWPGPVWSLDFTGHGQSTVPAGGGYTAEILMGDADTALAHLGPATVAGRGVGAYVALLIAGARPQLVRGAVLADGPGLAGGGTGPTSWAVVTIDGPGGRVSLPRGTVYMGSSQSAEEHPANHWRCWHSYPLGSALRIRPRRPAD